MVLLQRSASLSVSLLFLFGLLAGVGATLAVDVVMARLDEGAMPPQVASGVLTDTPPDAAPTRLASVVHYLAGTLTGALFVWLLLVAEAFLGAGSLAVAAAAVGCYPLMVGFFTVVVLPRARGVARQRLRLIRRAWRIEAAVYLSVLAPVVGVAAAVV